jgi:hypothetical protein
MQAEETIGRFLLKSFAFSVVFLLSWLFFYRPLSAYLSADTSTSAKAQSDAYDMQMKRSEALMTKSEAYSTRLEALMQTQEDNARRQAAVISAWERQAGIK